ncbi:MAG: IscS subfamily cysteine desulfurase [Candidatus Sumerlaeaceae bacterium]|nr:IscS subfamily cysteine desulfurase [Candidatus Sumerlaeaceae bacterium]
MTTQPRPIYMDHHATTPVDPRVLEAMLPYFSEYFGNASSRTHEFGWRAAEAVEAARAQVAALIGADADEIVFTSGATESNNLAILGAAEANLRRGRHVITCMTEHRAVLDPCRALEQRGWRVTRLPVEADGLLDPARLADAIEAETVLVSVMWANNEIGVIHPIAEIGRLCAQRGCLLHVDASQAAAMLPLDVRAAGVHLLSLSAHKMYGPKGIGALYVRRREPRVRLVPVVHGGGHERGLRSGTLNVPGIVGMGSAAAIARSEGAQVAKQLAALRDRLLAGLRARVPGLQVNGSLEHRLPNNLNVSIEGVEGESLIMGLRSVVAVSSGSACTSGSAEPSHVLAALGISPRLAHSSIRFGLGRGNTQEDVDRVVEGVAQVVARLRAMAPDAPPSAT